MEKDKDLPRAVTEKENLRELVQKSDVIFEGVVIGVEKPPEKWSDNIKEYQKVRYRVEQVIKGNHEEVEIVVDHVVVPGSRPAAIDPQALSSKLFAVNSWLIVSARKAENGTWKALDETYSALPATPEWSEKVEAAFHKD